LKHRFQLNRSIFGDVSNGMLG